jgi:hypothetical protein
MGVTHFGAYRRQVKIMYFRLSSPDIPAAYLLPGTQHSYVIITLLSEAAVPTIAARLLLPAEAAKVKDGGHRKPNALPVRMFSHCVHLSVRSCVPSACHRLEWRHGHTAMRPLAMTDLWHRISPNSLPWDLYERSMHPTCSPNDEPISFGVYT